MPNGGDKNWIRLCAALDGFQLRYGRWPTRVRIQAISLEDLNGHIFSREVFSRIARHIDFVVDESAGMIAEDDASAKYDYGNEGFPDSRPNPHAAEWLGYPPMNPGI